MTRLIHYRRKESLCRQLAVFDFESQWRWLAEADMWAHKVQDEISGRSRQGAAAGPTDMANPKAAAQAGFPRRYQNHLSEMTASGLDTIVMNQTRLPASDQNVSQ
jgi:hypothetical protein